MVVATEKLYNFCEETIRPYHQNFLAYGPFKYYLRSLGRRVGDQTESYSIKRTLYISKGDGIEWVKENSYTCKRLHNKNISAVSTSKTH